MQQCQAALQQRRSHADDRCSIHFPVDDVLPLLPGRTPCHSQIGERMWPVQPENTACGRACYCGRATYPYRDVIPFGITGMPVKASEFAEEDERMKFVSLVEKKRVHRHVGHSTGENPLYPGTGDAGRCFQNWIEQRRRCTYGALPSLQNRSALTPSSIIFQLT